MGHISPLPFLHLLPLPTRSGPEPIWVGEVKQEALTACFPRLLWAWTSKSPGNISGGADAALKELLRVGQHNSSN